DISGCAHLFGGEAALRRDLLGRLRAHGFAVRAAIANTVGCAWATARHGISDQSLPQRGRVVGEADRMGEHDDPHIVPPGGMRDALAPLPIAALRLPPDVVALLGQVGLKRIADVLALPRAALAARFGTELVLRLDQALGRDEESITPRQPLPRYVA